MGAYYLLPAQPETEHVLFFWVLHRSRSSGAGLVALLCVQLTSNLLPLSKATLPGRSLPHRTLQQSQQPIPRRLPFCRIPSLCQLPRLLNRPPNQGHSSGPALSRPESCSLSVLQPVCLNVPVLKQLYRGKSPCPHFSQRGSSSEAADCLRA